MFYLIGVNHNVQRHPPGATLDKDQTEFQRRLNEAIDVHHPKLIAVEESEGTLLDKRNRVIDESIPRNAAQRHGIDLMLCEPSNDEKQRIGIMDKSQIPLELFTSGLLRNCPSSSENAAAYAVEIALIFPLREEFWIEKLKKHLRSEVIFILGEDHIDSFIRRLQALGIQGKALVRGIGVTEAKRAEFEAARRFPIENPELFCALLQGIREKTAHVWDTGSSVESKGQNPGK
jgi:hypothetical protein